MKRCIIIGGAPINEYAFVRSYLKKDDFYIFCDSGLKHMDALGVSPDLIIGDFDSHENPNLNTETIVLPCEKDDTDTVFAVKEALKRGFDEFLLVGVVGKRIDHSIANISILLMLDSLNKKAMILDDYSEMEIVSRSIATIEPRFSFFSLLNIDGTANGITVENAKYKLDGSAKIDCEYQYGVSNEPLNGKTASVALKEGRLLLVKIAKE